VATRTNPKLSFPESVIICRRQDHNA
jgi:hypothetical protein